MKKLFNKVTAVLRNEKGQGMVEYGLIIALIAIVVIAALIILGPKIRDMLSGVASQLPAPT